jgi:hypothetical protein
MASSALSRKETKGAVTGGFVLSNRQAQLAVKTLSEK